MKLQMYPEHKTKKYLDIYESFKKKIMAAKKKDYDSTIILLDTLSDIRRTV